MGYISGTLSLGTNVVNKGLKKTIDDMYKKYIAGGGKKKIVTKVVKNKKLSVKELASKAKEKRKIKSKINKAEKVFSRKEYNKKLLDTLKNNKKNKISKNTTKKKSTELVTIPNKGTNVVKRKGTNVVTTPTKGTNVVKPNIPKNVTTKAGKLAYLKKHFKNNWKRYAIAFGLLAAPAALIPSGTTSKSSVINKDNKGNSGGNFSEDTEGDTSGTYGKNKNTSKVIKKELPKVKSNDYTGRFIDKKGDVGYDSASDFLAHMFGTPKKRAMPKKTARIIGTGNKLKRKEADTKGAGKGVKFKAFKSGTKDKTISQKQLDKNAKYKASNAYQLKNQKKISLMDLIKNPIKSIKKGAKDVSQARINASRVAAGIPLAEKKYGTGKRTGDIMSYMYPEGVLKFKPDGSVEEPLKSYKKDKNSPNKSGYRTTTKKLGGGLIAGLYDKPEKTEKYKGNSTSARQVKGYGKARKP